MQNFIYGSRAVIEAIDAGKEIEKVLIQSGLHNPLIKELKDVLAKHNLRYSHVPVEKINRITQKNHQGVLCFLSAIEYMKIENVLPMIFEKGESPLILILDRITDVRNIGAIARTAACSGVHAIVVPAGGSAQLNEDAVKTSAGALNKINVCRENSLKQTVQFLQYSGVHVVACTEKTNDLIYDCDYNRPLAIVMGSEEDGISNELIRNCDSLVKIPMTGAVGSLNVSVAAAVVLYEAVRQRLKA